MDPNILREKYLKINHIEKNGIKNLAEKIFDISPLSLACMKYQNNAINFIMKFNNTIREILKIQKKV